jgi:hypothetical protein
MAAVVLEDAYVAVVEARPLSELFLGKATFFAPSSYGGAETPDSRRVAGP